MSTLLEARRMPPLRSRLTERTERLRNQVLERGLTNRADDWIRPENLPDIAAQYPREPVIVRRALAIEAMLKAMTDKRLAEPTLSYSIFPGELLVGVTTMGSNGLGKVFPNYLTEDEKHMASIANRSGLSVLGHNAADYERLVTLGIRDILRKCEKQLAVADLNENKRDFYRAVKISCQAVVDYAARFSDLASEMANHEPPGSPRKPELLRIARVCRKVPMEPAETFYEALQSILFVHIALRAGMDFTSFGRLDKTLQRYLHSTVEPGVQDLDKAVELVECFVIKTAWPLNLSTQYLVEQDHMDYGILLGTRQYYTDQRGNTNNFLQNVVLGGTKPDGTDDTCDATHVILQAFGNTSLPTPGLYVRMHKHTPPELRERAAEVIARTGFIPAILNDEVIVPALRKALAEHGPELTEFRDLAFDYCVDGCWEPILNGKSDWTMNMVNGMTILECALNEGATLDSNPMTLRGVKKSFRTRKVTSPESLMNALDTTMEFLIFQSAVAMYNYYLLDEYITPTPLFSAFLGDCLETGRDKSWGGTRYTLGGTILEGLPNMVNSICAINKWVFEAKKYTVDQVLGAFRYDFTAPDTDVATQALYDQIHADFHTNSPKFGNNDPESNHVARQVTDCFYRALQKAKTLADQVYVEIADDPEEKKRRERLRQAAGYYGLPLKARLADFNFVIRFTAGLGTFEIYNLLGQGVAASADRHANDPLSMNITPYPGTVKGGIGHVIKSLQGLGLDRFAAGAVTDARLEVKGDENPAALVAQVIEMFIANHGHTLTLTLGKTEDFQTIYELSVAASKMADREKATELLKPWRHVNVRAGGWQSVFISLSLDQQKHYAETPADNRR